MACRLAGAKPLSEPMLEYSYSTRTNFGDNFIEFHTFSFKKMYLNMSFAKWWRFCLGLNVLIFTPAARLDVSIALYVFKLVLYLGISVSRSLSVLQCYHEMYQTKSCVIYEAIHMGWALGTNSICVFECDLYVSKRSMVFSFSAGVDIWVPYIWLYNN